MFGITLAGLTWGLGGIVGSVLGGVLESPVSLTVSSLSAMCSITDLDLTPLFTVDEEIRLLCRLKAIR